MSNIVFWIWLAERKPLRFSVRKRLLERFGEPKAVYYAGERELASMGELKDEELDALLDKSTEDAERIVSRCEEESVGIITMQDAVYPERLRNIPDPPCVLYVKGRLPDVDEEAVVTVVGTRKSTPYGDKMARKLGYGIAKCGGIVVSGLAEGIDSRAIEGALMARGTVIGVLGTAINVVFPSFNVRLFADTAAAGAIISEYPPDAEGNRSFFPQRNRIMAGLSVGVVVAEAPEKSGALITASRALDYGRDVFAVPANADAPNGRGCNALLRDGAGIAEEAWDVMSCYESLFPGKVFKNGKRTIPEERAVPEAPKEDKKPKDKPEEGFLKLRVPVKKKAEPYRLLEEQLAALTETQLKIVGVMAKPSMHIDDIIDLSEMPAATVLSEMTLMQIKGYVTQESGKRFTLKIAKRG